MKYGFDININQELNSDYVKLKVAYWSTLPNGVSFAKALWRIKDRNLWKHYWGDSGRVRSQFFASCEKTSSHVTNQECSVVNGSHKAKIWMTDDKKSTSFLCCSLVEGNVKNSWGNKLRQVSYVSSNYCIQASKNNGDRLFDFKQWHPILTDNCSYESKSMHASQAIKKRAELKPYYRII